MDRPLTDKMEAFCREFLVDLCATKAAERAGYSKKTAKQRGYELMNERRIQVRIQALMDRRAKRTDITADRVLQELASLGFANIQDLYDDQGQLLPPHLLPRELAAAVEEVTEETVGTGENQTRRWRYKIAGKKPPLELLGKHLRLFREQVQVSNPDGTPLFGGVRVSFVSAGGGDDG
jgi:phage terminase small subunit